MASKEPSCSVCGQTDSDPGPWGDESLAEMRANGMDCGPMEFEDCPECGSRHVCPDCICESNCCAEAEVQDGLTRDEAVSLRRQCDIKLGNEKPYEPKEDA